MKDSGHLIRLAVLFAAGFAVFLLARQALVPPGFGKYGHFRSGALDDVRARPVRFAGRAACEMCHEDKLKEIKSGKHAGLACEACHWAQAAHADDFTKSKPVLPDTVSLCPRCHAANSARPKWFPQVVVRDHAGTEPCKSCHQPHSPKVG